VEADVTARLAALELRLAALEDGLAGVPSRNGAGALSPAERRVVALVLQGRPNREVAKLLSRSVKTVEWQLTNVYRKLGVRSRAELIARVAEPPAKPRETPGSGARR
jgi:DNA-binding CsgD family transcriptional regulator